ncbi:hypothetical protein B0H15DRAFT_824520 [Mycena belliarum]|uniref:Uncharacterized protein n=1 Tax=Mycena belliarum TaxID=1033014 RepID=A0AAD6UF68_9AGAR|nr:hypothetical protein B0H15DRAFT_824520 [Mycena belliae]
MGSAASTVSTPVSFSPDLVDALADHALAPETPPERQAELDAHIRARIQTELHHLRAEEQAVRDQIHAALEKENLDREHAMAGDPDAVKAAPALLADLEQVRVKVDRFHARRDLAEYPALREHIEAVVACYKNNPAAPLDCWQQVDKFKASVAEMEQQHIKSLQ